MISLYRYKQAHPFKKNNSIEEFYFFHLFFTSTATSDVM